MHYRVQFTSDSQTLHVQQYNDTDGMDATHHTDVKLDT